MTEPLPSPPQTPRPARISRHGFAWDVVSVATSRFTVKAAQLASGVLIARLLGADGRGLVVALTVPSILAVNLSEMGIRQSTAFHLGKDLYPIERLLPTLMTLVPIASAIAVGASLIYYEVAGVADGDPWLRGLALAVIPFLLLASYATGVFLGRQRIAAFRKASWRPAFLNVVLIAAAGWIGGLGIYGVMFAGLAAAILSGGYALYLLRREGRIRLGFDREVARSLQRKGLSYAASLFVLMINYKVMILLLTRLSSLREVGVYGQAAAVAELIWEMPAVLGALVLSRGVNAKSEEGFSRKVLLLAKMAFLAAVGVSIALAVVAPYIFPFFYGPEFAASAPICIALLPGVVAFIVFKILNIDLAGRGRPLTALLIMLPVLAINVILGWWMITRFGAIGAAWASSITYIVAAMAYVLLYSRVVAIPLREMLLIRGSDVRAMLAALPFGRLR